MNKQLLLFVFVFCAFLTSFGQTYDATFAPVFSGPSEVSAMVKQSNDKIIIAGTFTTINSLTGIPAYVSGGLVRLNTDGTLDNTFNAFTAAHDWKVGSNLIYDLALQADGKIIVVGSFTNYNGVAQNGVIRLNSDGTVDNTFNIGTGPNASPSAFVICNVAIQPADGKIILRGRFSTFNGTAANNIIRLNTDGSIDQSFLANTENGGQIFRMPILVQSDGKIIIGGDLTKVNNTTVTNMARLNADGTLDATFTTNMGTGPNSGVLDIGVQSDGKIIIVGRFTQFNGATIRIVRLNTDGSRDMAFSTAAAFNSGNFLTSLKVLSNDKIVVGGNYQQPTKRIIRLNADGTVDSGFAVGTGLDYYATAPDVYDIVEQSDNKVIIAGEFSKYNGTSVLSLARISTAGVLDAAYKPNPAGVAGIKDIKLQSDGKILMTGSFTYVNGTYTLGVVRLNTNGTVDTGFSITGVTLPEASVNAIGIQNVSPNIGKIVLGGYYSNGTGGFMMRVSAAGAFDTQLASLSTVNSGDGIYSIKVQADDKLVIGGGFDGVNGNTIKNFARVNADLTSDNTFNTANLFTTSKVVKIVTRTSDGKMLTGEAVKNGSSAPLVSLINTDASKVTAFNINSKFNNGSFSRPTFLQDGKILIGGDFSSYDGVFTTKILKMDDAGVKDAIFKNSDNYTNYSITALYPLADKILVGKGDQNFSSLNKDNNYFDIMDLTGKVIPDPLSLDGEVSFIVPIPSTTSYYLAGGIRKSGVVNVGPIVKINTPAVPSAAPTSLGAVASAGPRKITLNWTDNSTNESGFEIQRSTTTNGSYATLAYVAANVTTYADQAVAAATQYYYKIRAVNITGQSAFATETNATTLPDAPGVPFNLTINSSTETQIVLKWNDGSSNEDGFEIYRSTPDNTNYTLLTTTAANILTYTNTGLTANGHYYYKIRAVNAGGASTFTTEIDKVTTISPPGSVTLTAQGPTKIKISWIDNSTIETGYKIYKGNTASTLLATVPANTTEYIATGLTPGTYNLFTLVTFNTTMESAPVVSNEIQTAQLVSGEWAVATVPTIPARSSAVSFVIGTKAYVGLGRNAAGTLKDFWEFDQATGNWTRKADYPGNARIGAVAFTINDKGYAGTGNDFSGTGFLTDFYEYNPAADTWTKKADFPKDFNSGAGITSGSAFVIGDFGYVGLGNTSVNNPTAFYRYDPAKNIWESKASFGGTGRYGATGFASNGKGYFAFGYGGVSANRKDIWEYDPTANTWTQKTDFSGTGRAGAASFVINSEAFLLGGEEGDFSTSVSTNAVSQFVPAFNIWRTLTAFPGAARTSAVAFAIGNMGYLFSGSTGSTYFSDLFTYKPGSAFLPAKPSAVVATFISDTSIKVNWTDASDNEDQFGVDISTGSTSVGSFVAANVTEKIYTDLIPGNSYSFRVRAQNIYGTSEYTISNVVYTIAIPAAPSELAGQALSTAQIKLTWKDNSTTETSFDIYRAEDGVTFSKINTQTSNVVEYTNAGLSASKEYTYKIQATNVNGPSPFSNVITVKTMDGPPATPSQLKVLSSTQTKIELGWTDNASNETGFEIFRQLTGAAAVSIGKVDANVVSFTNTDLQPGIAYSYFVKAFNTIGTSANSNTLQVTITLAVPEAPSELTAEIVSGSIAKIKLTWKDNSLFDEGFEIFRDGQANVYATVAKDVVTFTNQSFVDGQLTYKYKVRAKNSAGVSAFTNEVTVTFPANTITALADEPSFGISAFPNPVANQLLLQNKSNRDVRVMIFNSLGQPMVKENVHSESDKTINSEEWTSGVYILHVEGGKPLRIVKK